jgi:hypothetical protein
MLTESLWDWVCPTHDPTDKMEFPSSASQRDADTELSPRLFSVGLPGTLQD